MQDDIYARSCIKTGHLVKQIDVESIIFIG